MFVIECKAPSGHQVFFFSSSMKMAPSGPLSFLFFFSWIRRAPCGHKVFFLLIIEKRSIWWPSGVFIFCHSQEWHLVTTKFFFLLLGLKRHLVATKCCVLLIVNKNYTQQPLGVMFYLLLMKIALGGHQVHFFPL